MNLQQKTELASELIANAERQRKDAEAIRSAGSSAVARPISFPVKKPNKKQQALWSKGEAMYSDFLEYLSFIHEPNARKIARTPRTHTLELFVEAKDQRTRNQLMLAEYRSNLKEDDK